MTLHAYQMLDYYQGEIISMAQQAGIDGNILLQQLPPPGRLFTGNKVPVIASKYRGTCSVLFYINISFQGLHVPFLRFHTFKHGGITLTFNGMEYLKDYLAEVKRDKSRIRVLPKVDPTLTLLTEEQENKKRLQRTKILAGEYYSATPLSLNARWLQRRFVDHANASLLNRVDIRCNNQQALLVPLQHCEYGFVGYHKIFTNDNKDQKRHFILKAGLLKGSYLAIRAQPYAEHHIAGICEGLATGLAIALCWDGPIYVALTANNLAAVRKTIPNKRVCFFSDNDQWKSHVGNVGVNAARKASFINDIICIPQFSEDVLKNKPTDFNDLLILEGFSVLQKQILNYEAF